MVRLAIVFVFGLLAPGLSAGWQKPAPAAANPSVVLETEKGVIEIEFYADAPKSVGQIIGLFQKGFYLGLRFHRVTDSLVQIGDPQTRNVRLEAQWGTMGSGTPVGVAEISKTHWHTRGAVGLAYAGGPQNADSQFYIMKSPGSSLDGKYAVIGHVIKGMDVVDRLQKGDVLKTATLKGVAPK